MQAQAGKFIGLIGGLGVGAAIHYYRELSKAHDALGRKLQLAMIHADMARALEYARAGDREALAHYLATLIESLRAAGAQLAVIPAVTPHLCAQELASLSSLPFVNILTTTEDAIVQAGFRRVAVFGTRFSIETGLFGQVRAAEIIQPRMEEVDFIHNTYVQIAESGRGSDEMHDKLSALAQHLIARERLDGILLAGTDLAVLFDEDNTHFPHIDCAREHIRAILRHVTA